MKFGGRKTVVAIREGSLEDLPAVAELEKRCFPDPWTERMLRDSFLDPARDMLVAEERNGVPAGYCLCMRCGDEVEVLSLAVRPELRRQGIGTGLLHTLIERAKEYRLSRVYLDVRRGNDTAIRLYAGLGFVESRIRDRYYSDGETAVVMSRTVCAEAATS